MRYVKVMIPDDIGVEPTTISGEFDLGDSIEKRDLKVFSPTYTSVHTDCFVGLVDFMGTDEDIPQAARTSYAKGTKKVSTDRNLIRYLTRKMHTSPIEMVEFKFHIKCPIFVARQWLRHRTASVNEQSARYSELPETFYVPDPSYLAPQSQSNKQGRDGDLSNKEKQAIINAMHEINQSSYETYEYLLGKDGPPREVRAKVISLRNAVLKELRAKQENGDSVTQKDIDKAFGDIPYEVIEDEQYPGLARELARIVIPVSIFTEFYWKIDLHNLFHFLRLRMDSHAQQEIQDYANVVGNLVKDIVPDAWEAFIDYRMESRVFSRMELSLISELLSDINEEEVRTSLTTKGCSKREIDEFFVEVINKRL